MISTEARDVQFFTSSGLITDTNWFTWNKPKNTKFVMMLVQGSGGGGGKPNNGVAGNGGKGGGSGACIRTYGPAHLLPDVLYISPGIGGLGATTAGATGESGTNSYVCVEPITTSFLFEARGGPGGPLGSAAQTAAAAQSSFFGISAYFYNQALAGVAGSNGANTTSGNGSTISIFSTQLITTAGTGGGSGSGTGGSLNSNGIIPTVSGGTNNGGAGRNGFGTIHSYFKDYGINPYSLGTYTTGGTGGGGNNNASAAAGKGGDGALGCGGGGGGGSSSNSGTSGNGGNGGNGYVFIISY